MSLKQTSFAPFIAMFALGGLFLGNTAYAAAFQNGSFETHSFDLQSAAGWTKTGNVGFGPGAGSTSGIAAAGFNGDNSAPNAVLYQTFDTFAGTTYTVMFDFGQLQASLIQQLLVEVKDFTSGVQLINSGSGTVNTSDGGFIISNNSLFQVADITGAAATTGIAPNAEFSTFTFTFTAVSGSSTLSFTDQANGTVNSDGVLDSVRVIPEPSTSAILIGGLGIFGVLRRLPRESICNSFL